MEICLCSWCGSGYDFPCTAEQFACSTGIPAVWHNIFQAYSREIVDVSARLQEISGNGDIGHNGLDSSIYILEGSDRAYCILFIFR